MLTLQWFYNMKNKYMISIVYMINISQGEFHAYFALIYS